jgi:hypothetical protein
VVGKSSRNDGKYSRNGHALGSLAHTLARTREI